MILHSCFYINVEYYFCPVSQTQDSIYIKKYIFQNFSNIFLHTIKAIFSDKTGIRNVNSGNKMLDTNGLIINLGQSVNMSKIVIRYVVFHPKTMLNLLLNIFQVAPVSLFAERSNMMNSVLQLERIRMIQESTLIQMESLSLFLIFLRCKSTFKLINAARLTKREISQRKLNHIKLLCNVTKSN